MAAYDPGCVKTQKRPLEIDFKLPSFAVEVRGLFGVSLRDKQPVNAISLGV